MKNKIERDQIDKDSVQDQDIYLGDLYMAKASKHHYSQWYSPNTVCGA